MPRRRARSKYAPLTTYLAVLSVAEVALPVAEIESIIGKAVPPLARRRQFWSNGAQGVFGVRPLVRSTSLADLAVIAGHVERTEDDLGGRHPVSRLDDLPWGWLLRVGVEWLSCFGGGSGGKRSACDPAAGRRLEDDEEWHG